MNISVIGLGKLGLCTAGCFAAAGHNVIGYDTNASLMSSLKEENCPIDENGLPELLAAARPRFSLAAGYAETVNRSDITLIIVPTPSQLDGRFSNEWVKEVLHALAPELRRKSSFHVMDIVSTVMPDSCDALFVPLLELATGKICGADFGVVYNPEFIALGSVIRDFLNPDIVLIGASDERSSAMVRALYESTCKSRPAIKVMSLVNAEIAKISLNCFVTMKISYANALAALCERVPGADVDVVTSAVGADSRVGSNYLKGGLGFGGPCFPRDNLAFQAFAREIGGDAPLGDAVVTVNNRIPVRLRRLITEHIAPPARLALLGLSYKADTHIVEASQGILLARSLLAAGYRVSLHDPKALSGAHAELGDAPDYADGIEECIADASAIALLTDWPEYRSLDWQRMSHLVRPPCLLLDCWRVAREVRKETFIHRPVGVGIR
jgi:UDPglucose 6-dehydrogenase